MDKNKGVLGTYLSIPLDSMGKLGVPKELHFRDYTIDEIYELSVSTVQDNLEVLIGCFNKMVKEDYDCKGLHYKDVITIMLTVHNTWWGQSLTKKMYIDPDIEDYDLLNDKANIMTEDIPISCFKTAPLKDEFKNPFTVSIIQNKTETTVTCILPTVGNMIDAEAYVKDTFFEQERKLSDLLGKVEAIQQISSYEEKAKASRTKLTADELKQYRNYQKDLDKARKMYMQACCFTKINDEEYLTIEDRIEHLPEIPLQIWQRYNQVISDYDFGVDDEVTFDSVTLKNPVTRRLGFRLVELIPNMEQKGVAQGTVRFG